MRARIAAFCILLAGCPSRVEVPKESASAPAPPSVAARWHLAAGVRCPSGVEGIAADGHAVWSRPLPAAWLAAGACPLPLDEDADLGARSAASFEHAGRFVVATEAGILLLARDTGQVLLQHDLPDAEERPTFFDHGTFTFSGGPTCQGDARRGEVLAMCASSLVVLHGPVALLIDVARAEVVSQTRITAAMVTHGAHAQSAATIPLGSGELRLQGITYLR